MSTADEGVRVLGPVVLTATELGLLEEAHRRLLEAADPDGAGVGSEVGPGAGFGWRTGDDGCAGDDWCAGDDPCSQEARRSLVARGILAPDGTLPEEDDVGLLVSTLLDVRLGAEVVLAVGRVVGTPADGPAPAAGRPGVERATRLVHVAGGAACVEDLLPGEAHHLHLLLECDDVPGWVAAAVVPPDAAPGEGAPLAVDPADAARLADLLGRPTVLGEVGVLRGPWPDGRAGDGAGHHLLALGPAGCWQGELDPESGPAAGVVLRPVDPGWVQRWARSALAAPAPTTWEDPQEGQGTMAG